MVNRKRLIISTIAFYIFLQSANLSHAMSPTECVTIPTGWIEISNEETDEILLESPTIQILPPSSDTLYETTPWTYYGLTDTDWQYLIAMTQAEAGNQPDDGVRAVLSVALNRLSDPNFPDSMEKVIKQKRQFSTYRNGQITHYIAKGTCPRIEALALEELVHRSYPNLYYFSAHHYGESGTPWGVIGDHYFSTK